MPLVGWSCITTWRSFFPAILYYDYLLTFPLEVQFLWSPGNQGWLTLACLTNRYLPLFGHIPLAVSYFRSQRDIPVRPRSLICVTVLLLLTSYLGQFSCKLP